MVSPTKAERFVSSHESFASLMQTDFPIVMGTSSLQGLCQPASITPGCGITGLGNDNASDTSDMSWISVRPHCFMSNALFRTISDQTEFYLSGDKLVKGSRVLADDCKTILEVVCKPEQFEVNKVIKLQAGDATLFVTPDHRVPVLRGPSGEPCDVQAQDIQQGDSVFVNGFPSYLTSVEQHVLPQNQTVLKIAFQPDMPVAVFTPPPAISTKGYMMRRIRRGGMSKRGQPGKAAHDHLSIPDTAPGFYQD